jgi:hypothetical protein
MTRGWLLHSTYEDLSAGAHYPKELVIEPLCGLPARLAGRGFRVSAEILLVRLRRGRPLDYESQRCRPAVFPSHLRVYWRSAVCSHVRSVACYEEQQRPSPVNEPHLVASTDRR